jgi:hypothetical protein
MRSLENTIKSLASHEKSSSAFLIAVRVNRTFSAPTRLVEVFDINPISLVGAEKVLFTLTAIKKAEELFS